MSREDYVLLLMARDEAEAEYYEMLLDDHDVSIMIEEDDIAEGQGFAVMVSCEQLEEAEHIIEQRANLDDEFEQDCTRDDDGGDDEDGFENGDFEISSVDDGEVVELDELDDHEDEGRGLYR